MVLAPELGRRSAIQNVAIGGICGDFESPRVLWFFKVAFGGVLAVFCEIV